MLLLVPCDPVDPRRPDEHFAAEHAAARHAGHAVALVDHDALAAGDATEGVRRVRAHLLQEVDPGASGDAVYRGWMLRSEHYAAAAAALADRGVTLRTGAAQYRTAHELPGWVEALAPVTPESRWTTGAALDDLAVAGADLGPGPAVLRDWTKSLKHSWHEACFVPDAADPAVVRRVGSRFLELRGNDLVGGLVLRRFERFTGVEARTWWVDGVCALVTPHPDTDADGAPALDVVADLAGIAPLVAGLALPFVTVDVVLRDDGVWRVVELGDGQVSDRPRSTPPEALLAALSPSA